MSKYLDYLSRKIGYESYQNYLLSDHWRTFAARHRKPVCFCCDTSGLTELHHKTYIHLGFEKSTDCVSLCSACHDAVHALATTGVPLFTAHEVHKQRLSQSLPPPQRVTKPPKHPKRRRRKKPHAHWVPLPDLLASVPHLASTQVRTLLITKHLLQVGSPTSRALNLGYARRGQGGCKWSIQRLHRLIEADHLVSCMQDRREVITAEQYRAALVIPYEE